MAKFSLMTLTLLLGTLAACGGAQKDEAGTSAPGTLLTGLYEGGQGPRRHQLCMIEREGRSAAFGFTIWGKGDRSCGGRGTVQRDGDTLRLQLDGDPACVIAARLGDGRVSFPAEVSAECARYYCGDGAAMADAQFAAVGTSDADARKATDLVGDPLCPA